MSTHDGTYDLNDLGRGGAEAGGVGGGWLGTFAFKGVHREQAPVRFEATLTEPDGEGRFRGTILDDKGLGEATVKGGQSGRGVRFSKRYKRRGQASVSYEGTLAADGRTMAGTWRIADTAHGVWDARRLWAESEEDESEQESEGREQEREESEEREAVRVREVVRLG